MQRPLGITVLAFLQAVSVLVLLPLSLWLWPLEATRQMGGLWGTLALAGGVLVAAVGLWRGAFAGWVASLLVAGARAGLSLRGADGPLSLLALALPAVVVGYLLTRDARRWCGVAPGGAPATGPSGV